VLTFHRRKIVFAALLYAVALLFFVNAVPAEQDPLRGSVSAKRIGILPFQSLSPESGNTVFCPFCGLGASGGKILEGAEKTVEDIFTEKLKTIRGLEIIPQEKVQGVYARVSSEQLRRSFAETLKLTGQELGVDYLAVGYVYRYAERVGFKYSSERPASVVFEIHLVRAADGADVWRGFFDKTQKSLMEDVLQVASFLRGGAKWVTARQLAGQGMDEVFKSFPDFQQ